MIQQYIVKINVFHYQSAASQSLRKIDHHLSSLLLLIVTDEIRIYDAPALPYSNKSPRFVTMITKNLCDSIFTPLTHSSLSWIVRTLQGSKRATGASTKNKLQAKTPPRPRRPRPRQWPLQCHLALPWSTHGSPRPTPHQSERSFAATTNVST